MCVRRHTGLQRHDTGPRTNVNNLKRRQQKAQEKQNVSMGPRLHVDEQSLDVSGAVFALGDGPSRHVQVLRMQPGHPLRVFDGRGKEWQAEVAEMGRKVVQLRVLGAIENDRELPVKVTLAVGLTANDRMDTLVEKATELGAHAIQPLECNRSVLRLDAERARKKVAHWQAVAVAASEQCGRSVVPQVLPVLSALDWLRLPAQRADSSWQTKGVLSLREAQPVGPWLSGAASNLATPAAPLDRPDWCFFSGPEGGLTAEEEDLARACGWQAVSLGRRVLRADTAPLAVLSVIAAQLER